MASSFFRVVLVATVMGGCSLFQPSVTSVKSAGAIHGKQVDVGFFKHEGLPGEYVLIQHTDRWVVKSVSPSPMDVPEGDELLFVLERQPGVVSVTPAFPDASPIDQPTMLFSCDVPAAGYGPCRSDLVTNTPPPLKRAGIDRDAILRALDEGSVFEAIAAHEAETRSASASLRAESSRRDALANAYSKFVRGARVRVARVNNSPGIVPVNAEDVARIVSVASEPATANMDGTTHVTFRAQPGTYVVYRPFGNVECGLTLDKNTFEFDFTGRNDAPVLDFSVNVERCDVGAPHPEPYVAMDKAKVLIVKLATFDPHGSSSFWLTNTSDEFVKVSSISVYYFGKIVTADVQQASLPPRSTTTAPVNVASDFSIPGSFTGVTRDNVDQKRFEFGVAVRFTRGGASESTLLDQRQFSLGDLLRHER